MNIRKLFALLMTAIMLLGMTSAGHASGNMLPGGEMTVACDHNWAYRFPNGKPAHCLDEKISEEYCTKCGAAGDRFYQNGRCQPGSWQWEDGRPRCEEWGVQVAYCKKCGENLESRRVRVNHNWGEKVISDEPTCMQEGHEYQACTYCGEKNWEKIPKVDHNMGDWYVVRQPEVGLPGLEQRDCTYGCGTFEQRDIPELTQDFDPSQVAVNAELIKSIVNEPANGEYFVPGEVIEFNIAIHNNGNKTLDVVVLTDPLSADFYHELLDIPGGAMDSRTLSYTVTEFDVEVGNVTNYAYAVVYVDDQPTSLTSNTVVAPCGKDEAAVNAELIKSIVNEPANGEYFVPGEVIEFNIAIHNNGNKTLDVVVLTDPLSADFYHELLDIPGGAMDSRTLNYTVTEFDVEVGNVTNYAYAVVYVDDQPTSLTSNTVVAPCGKDEAAVNAELIKSIVNTPANGEYFVPGESIVYRVTLINNTGVELKGVALYDPLYSTPVISPDGEGSLAIAPRLAVGESISGEFSYEVTAEAALTGKVVNTAEALYVYADDPQAMLYRVYSNTLETPVGIGDLPELYCSFGLSNVPANNEYYVPGETVRFEVQYSNPSLYPLVMGYVLAHVKDTPDVNTSGLATMTVLDAADVPAGEFEFVYISYTVTEEDAARGAIYGYAAFTANLPNGTPVKAAITDFVTVPCGVDNFGNCDLSVTKAVTSTPANGLYYVPGEEIQFSITVQNNMDKTLDVVVLTDPLSADFYHELLDIPGGAMDSRTLSYTVTEFDAEIGSVTNYAYAVAYVGDKPTSLTSNTVTAPCGYPAGDEPFGIFHSLALSKKEESLPLNGQYYTEGEVIHYVITYTNDGELPLTDVQVWDNMDIDTTIGHAEMLQPGESRICYYQHTVTAEDVAAGYVLNMAQASYPIPGGEGCIGVNSNLVYSKTSDKTVWVEYYIYPIPGGEPGPLPGGSIDAGKLQGTDHCVRTITGRDSASVSYETAFCSAHGGVQNLIAMMKQAANTPQMQQQTAAYAVSMWRAEAEKIYQQLLNAADPIARMNVMMEFTTFMNEIVNYEAVLKALYPEQPELVAMKVADMWESMCVSMCCEADTSADKRADSLLQVTPAEGAAEERCSCEASHASGTKTEVQRYCATHSFPFSMIDVLLAGNDTEQAWAAVRQIWNVELNGVYNKLSAKLGDSKLLAMAEHNALTQWMTAREASLTALYPDHPEVVAQIMVKLIMERTSLMCSLLP